MVVPRAAGYIFDSTVEIGMSVPGVSGSTRATSFELGTA
jgi:hypothetical protein